MAYQQLDLFAPEQKPDPSGDEYADRYVVYPDPNRVRARLNKWLSEARASETCPWDARKTDLYRFLIPQMSGCLPKDEAERLCLEFETEMARLGVE